MVYRRYIYRNKSSVYCLNRHSLLRQYTDVKYTKNVKKIIDFPKVLSIFQKYYRFYRRRNLFWFGDLLQISLASLKLDRVFFIDKMSVHTIHLSYIDSTKIYNNFRGVFLNKKIQRIYRRWTSRTAQVHFR